MFRTPDILPTGLGLQHNLLIPASEGQKWCTPSLSDSVELGRYNHSANRQAPVHSTTSTTTPSTDSSPSLAFTEEAENSDNDEETDEAEFNGDQDRERHANQFLAEQLEDKRKFKRFRLTHSQTRFLLNEFARQPHPDAANRSRLSREIPGFSPRQVQVWFQNRRAKLKQLPADDQERVIRSRALPMDFDFPQTLRPTIAGRYPIVNTQRDTRFNHANSMITKREFQDHSYLPPLEISPMLAYSSGSNPGSNYVSPSSTNQFRFQLPTQDDMLGSVPERRSPSIQSAKSWPPSTRNLAPQYTSNDQNSKKARPGLLPTSQPIYSAFSERMTSCPNPEGSITQQIERHTYDLNAHARLVSTMRQRHSPSTLHNMPLLHECGMSDTFHEQELPQTLTFHESTHGSAHSPELNFEDDPAECFALPIKTETHDLRNETPLPGFMVQAEHMKRRQGYYKGSC